jgi:tRNA(fMet)-specific endonuclease VapC
LWIAAIAIRHGLTLVSADSDFERVAQVEDLRVERWWAPELG